MPRGVYERNRVAGSAGGAEAQPSQRASEERRERRRRDDGDLDGMARMKLAIPAHIKEQAEREGKTLRWVRDDVGRMQQMQAEDWDRVEGVDGVSASRSDDSQMILMSKYKDWFDADRAHLKDTNKSLQTAAVSGKAPGSGVDTEGFYTPQGATNRISRGG